MSQTRAPGEKPMIDGVKEQRVTVFCVNAALGKPLFILLLFVYVYTMPLFILFQYSNQLTMNFSYLKKLLKKLLKK